MFGNTKGVIVAGIGTEVGKTLVSAILVEALKADYWKPVQAGELDFTDSDKVRAWTSHKDTHFFPEAYRLQAPMSPHAAAAREGIYIDAARLKLPKASNFLVIELAGGLMVPLSHDFLNINLVQQLRLPVILVSRYYLGSINHTLLSLELLIKYSVPCLGIIFNGNPNEESKSVILKWSRLRALLNISLEREINQKTVQKYANQLQLGIDMD